MTTSPQPKSSARMVVLLRPAERNRLRKLAEREHVSSAEIVRRSLQAYEQNVLQPQDDLSAATIAEMNRALDDALAAVQSARAEVAGDLASIQRLKGMRA